MKDSSGRVRKVVVDNVSLFTDFLARFLCKEGVCYLQIDIEFHLSNAILQFYDINEYEVLKDEFGFSGIDGDNIVVFDVYTIASVRPDIKGFEDGLIDTLTMYDGNYCPEDYSDDKKNKTPVYTKKMIRHNNRVISQRFKNSYGNGRINRRFY